jgi:hypothetical protein
VRRCFALFKQLSPGERQQLLDRHKAFKNFPPEECRKIKECSQRNLVALKLFDRLDQFPGHGLAITVEHAGVVTEEQGVFDAGETLALAALDNDDIF